MRCLHISQIFSPVRRSKLWTHLSCGCCELLEPRWILAAQLTLPDHIGNLNSVQHGCCRAEDLSPYIGQTIEASIPSKQLLSDWAAKTNPGSTYTWEMKLEFNRLQNNDVA